MVMQLRSDRSHNGLFALPVSREKVRGLKAGAAHLDTTDKGNISREHTQPAQRASLLLFCFPRVSSATPSSLTFRIGFSEGAEPGTRGRVRSPKTRT